MAAAAEMHWVNLYSTAEFTNKTKDLSSVKITDSVSAGRFVREPQIKNVDLLRSCFFMFHHKTVF